ncbi:hypothetical protein BGZ65_012994 [Modicella reniformis]|uniref:Uncharacterized protein n=1 Tax=Modicella reniformis TaxID=1440133 RepID=A0A9P6MBY9_9FUNG|nr:hypothetical protein BGZ65_012994 [Modicella reniformis]
MTNPETAHTKSSTMEHIKDKATNLVHKVTDKLHGNDYTTHNTTVNSTVDPANHHNLADHRGHHRGEGLAGPHLHDQHQQQPKHSGPLHTGAALAGAAVPHDKSVDRGAYQQHLNASAPVAPTTGTHGTHTTGGLQHPAPAGPTGTTNVPTYAQNIAPTAAGVVPTARSTEQDQYHKRGDPIGIGHHDHHHHHKAESGVGFPMNTNNSTIPVNTHNLPQANPVHSTNAATGPTNTVPVMSAPSTTTAAGTHIPGEYNAATGPTNTVPAMGAPGTTTAAGTHLPGEYNVATTTIPGATTTNPADRHTPVL